MMWPAGGVALADNRSSPPASSTWPEPVAPVTSTRPRLDERDSLANTVGRPSSSRVGTRKLDLPDDQADRVALLKHVGSGKAAAAGDRGGEREIHLLATKRTLRAVAGRSMASSAQRGGVLRGEPERVGRQHHPLDPEHRRGCRRSDRGRRHRAPGMRSSSGPIFSIAQAAASLVPDKRGVPVKRHAEQAVDWSSSPPLSSLVIKPARDEVLERHVEGLHADLSGRSASPKESDGSCLRG